MRKKYILIAVLVWVLLIALGFYFYNKPHSNAANEKTDVVINAPELFQEFQRDETSANSQFVDKVIEVKGTVMEVQHSGIRTSLQLDAGNAAGGVNCSLADNRPNYPNSAKRHSGHH